MRFRGEYSAWKGEADMDEKVRVQKAEEKALERLDYILDHYSSSDFVEIVGRVGGDTVAYRIYNDGRMYEG